MGIGSRFQKIISIDEKLEKKINNYFQISYDNKICQLKKIIRRNYLIRKYGITLGLNVSYGGKLNFPHPHNIVIGDSVSLGNNCTIYQNVTIGKKGNLQVNENAYPRIGDNVTICTGAVILGDIKIGDNVIIGANAVVTKDLPNNIVAAGVPARIIKSGD
ncbi:2,3,4,5-tetrahydropyridine-2,6-dicarboxylate N-acetyltransferase [Terrisporobacter petrolearius]|uniref:serine O-acetyltransferase n=1 Tax=Terrisporobacter petrolearius TaxID=1460447 RepID=UPI003369B6F5